MQFIDAFNPAFRTMGRIGESKNHLPLWVFPYTQARFRFTGTSLAVRLRNFWNYGHTRIGVIIDNTQFSVRVPSPVEPEPDAAVSVGEDGMLTIRIASHLPNIEHRAIVFKREDGGMHYMEFAGVEIDDDAQILAPAEPASTRRIEVYGDSVSCGERNEAVLCTGKADPDEDLSAYSNSWFAYDAIAARALGADLRIISQGGAPLLDGIGWFNAPDYRGMESIWDRVQYKPALGEPTDWDFRDDDPQVVMLAEQRRVTRAEVAVDYGLAVPGLKLMVVGSAPAAINRLIQRRMHEPMSDVCVLAAPSGFASAVQLKERLLDSDLASIIARGKKGGIPATVTLVNAILREISGKSIV